MKKSLIAMAVLAASGAAMAQSSVTMYGVVEATTDLGFKSTTDVTNLNFSFTNANGVLLAPAVLTTSRSVEKASFRLQDGNSQGVGTSRIGWRGVEDLGGGMAAKFQLEMGLRIDDGCTTDQTSTCAVGGSSNSGGNTFGRNAWVGASGGFGEVRLGRQVLGSFGVQANGWVAGSSNGLYDAGSGTAPLMGGVRFANAIKYITPNLGGFSGNLTLRAPEGSGSTSAVNAAGLVATTDSTNKTGFDLAAEYANGPIYAGFGYNKVDRTTASNNGLAGAANIVTSTSGPVKAWTLSASYNFGVAQPFFNYTRQTTDGRTSTITGGVGATGSSTQLDKAYSLGVKVPLGAVTLIAGYGENKITGSGFTANNGILATSTAVTGKVKAFQIGAQYALSKRTLIEANYGENKSDVARATATPTPVTTTVASTGTRVKTNALNVGLRHSF